MQRHPIMVATLLGALALAQPAGAADMLLLQQRLEGEKDAAAFVMLDRERISLVRVTRRSGFEHRVEVTLDPEDDPQLELRCADLAAARQVLEALRPGAAGPVEIDLTGRCRIEAR
jgi:hypothetical protein